MSPLVPHTGTQLIFGCGYLGLRVARLWLANGRRVAAVTRTNGNTLRSAGIEPITGDVCNPESFRTLPAAATVLYAVGMDRSAGKSMRDVYVSGLGHVLDTLPPCSRFVYVSGTSVYGQSNGEWVNEDSPTDPTEEAGKVVLEAEQLLRAKKPDAIILRCAGLYGPNRLLRKRPILNGEPLVGDADKWLNLVHITDAASVVLLAESHATPGETYNIADGAPVSRSDFYTRLAELLHAPEPKFVHRAEQGAPNRRIDATKFRALGWEPVFASYREGLSAAVAETTMLPPPT